MPPGTGICHQVNLEYLAQTVWTRKEPDGKPTAGLPDTLVGTDSHTTMVNGLAVLGWGVGGIEAEAAMLGQPISMLIPEVIGFRLTGKLREGVTATDLVLTVTQMLRKKGVVGKFVEFFGAGLGHLSLEDRATIANMAPEYGATCGFFPIDDDTLAYLRATGREPAARRAGRGLRQGAGHVARQPTRPTRSSPTRWSSTSASVEPSLAGPKRPQDRVPLASRSASTPASPNRRMDGSEFEEGSGRLHDALESHGRGRRLRLGHGDVVIAAITSCTNTSNPSVLIARRAARPQRRAPRA